jgi:hypothetical protein
LNRHIGSTRFGEAVGSELASLLAAGLLPQGLASAMVIDRSGRVIIRPSSDRPLERSIAEAVYLVVMQKITDRSRGSLPVRASNPGVVSSE